MNRILFAGLTLLAILVLPSCYYDKAELLYPQAMACDTVGAISYNQKIVPLFQQQCLPCHTVASPDAGIILGVYASDRAIAQNGKLFGSVSHASGYQPMPKGKLKMTNCQVATIKKWIDNGFPNN